MDVIKLNYFSFCSFLDIMKPVRMGNTKQQEENYEKQRKESENSMGAV